MYYLGGVNNIANYGTVLPTVDHEYIARKYIPNMIRLMKSYDIKRIGYTRGDEVYTVAAWAGLRATTTWQWYMQNQCPDIATYNEIQELIYEHGNCD